MYTASFGIPAFSYHPLLATIYHAEDLRYSGGGGEFFTFHYHHHPTSHCRHLSPPTATVGKLVLSCLPWATSEVRRGMEQRGVATVSIRQRTEFASSVVQRWRISHPLRASLHN